MIYVNKLDNKITFKIKTGYYLECVTPQTMKLLRATKSKTTKDKNGENVPHLATNEVILLHCNIGNNELKESCTHLFLMHHLVND